MSRSKDGSHVGYLRNIFCVAAGRGKNHIIFVKPDDAMLFEKTLSTFVATNQKFDDLDISEMFNFKYKEDVEKCQIDAAIELKFLLNPELKGLYTKAVKNSSLDEKILFLVSLETEQKRYRTQVITPFVSEEQSEALKFVSELTHEHFLQCACYMVAMNLPKGILWNTRDNTSFEIEVPERKTFLDAVTKAVTKGVLENYYGSVEKSRKSVKSSFRKKSERNTMGKFAVSDTEK